MKIPDRRKPDRRPVVVNACVFIAWGLLVGLQHEIFMWPHVHLEVYSWMDSIASHEFWGWGAFLFGITSLFSILQPWWRSRFLHWFMAAQSFLFWWLLCIASLFPRPIPTEAVFFGLMAFMSLIQIPAVFPGLIDAYCRNKRNYN